MADKPLFTIDPTTVREETTLGPGNTGLVQVHIVPYTVTSGPAAGHAGEVRVSPTDFTPDSVDVMIRDRIATLEGITQLGSTGAELGT